MTSFMFTIRTSYDILRIKKNKGGYTLSINERFKEIRILKNMSQEQFGKIIGLSKSGISNIENNTRNVTEKHIKLMCSELNVCEDYLRSGTGEPFSKIPQTTMDALKKEFNLNNYDLNLIYSYLQLSSEKRAAIREFFQNIAANETIDQIKEK